MSVGGARQEGFDDGGLRDLYCQSCGAYVGSYAPADRPKRAVCRRCAARSPREYWSGRQRERKEQTNETD